MSLKFFSNLCGLVCSFHCHTVVSWSRSDSKLFLAVEIKPAQEVAELKCPPFVSLGLGADLSSFWPSG